MAEINQENERCFKDAVCVDAGRVYDSCCDRDCLEDLIVYLSAGDQRLVDTALNARVRSAELNGVFIDVEPETFNKGYYSVNMTFYFNITADVVSVGAGMNTVEGIAFFEKKVILYGGEGSALIYSSQYLRDEPDDQLVVGGNLPRAVCQTVDPIVLSSRITPGGPFDNIPQFPEPVIARLGVEGFAPADNAIRFLEVTLGLFTVVQLIRNVQMLIPVYDFCIPQKECVNTADSPCERFSRIKFPTQEFFPPAEPTSEGGGCSACGEF